jgi:hypothetical protein
MARVKPCAMGDHQRDREVGDAACEALAHAASVAPGVNLAAMEMSFN